MTTSLPPLARRAIERLSPAARITVLDCGARGGGEGWKWKGLGPRLRLHGFEADGGECERLNQLAAERGEAHTYYPLCLWRAAEARRPLYVTRQFDSSSLYPPAARRIARWRQCDGKSHIISSEVVALARTAEVRTTTLAEWAAQAEVSTVDHVKLDVQGAELGILEGSGPLLDTALALEVEVEFTPIYEGQPLFADVDAFLRKRGFTFFTLQFSHNGHFVGRRASPVTMLYEGRALLPSVQSAGQLVTADAVYFRDPLESSWPAGQRMSVDRYLTLMILAEVCQQVEYAFELAAGLADGSAPVEGPADRAGWAELVRGAAADYGFST